MAGEYISITEFSRKNNYDANLLGRLIRQYNIKPDIKTGKARLFRPERLQSIVEDLDSVLKR